MRRRCLTLIEVLAALVLLGATIVPLLLAQAKALKQHQASQRRQTAQRLSRELLAEWELERIDLCQADEGAIADLPTWSWRRSVETVQIDGRLPMLQITLQLFYRSDGETQVLAQYRWLEYPADVAKP